MKPILFNTEMVRAILDGRKTVTRRIVKFPKHVTEIDKELGKFHVVLGDGYYGDSGECGPNELISWAHINPYKVGDVLYVRETWSLEESLPYDNYVYRTNYGTTEDDSFPPSMFKWKPSIHMPKEAARIFLRVTGVRVERLQDMKTDDPMKEGIRSFTKDGSVYKFAPCDGWLPWSEMPRNPTKAFELLWNSTIKKTDLYQYGWNTNPWVWVIEFERCEKEVE